MQSTNYFQEVETYDGAHFLLWIIWTKQEL